MLVHYSMTYKKIFWSILFAFTFIYAQSETVDATIVKLTGETLYVKVKPIKDDDKFARGVQVYNDTTQTFERLTVKELSYFKYESDEYYAKKNTDGKLVFMHKKMDGEANLYTYIYKDSDKNKVITEYYIEKKGKDNITEITNKNFKETASTFFSDNADLSEKINEKYYTFEDKEAVIEDYNDWVSRGKPGKVWKKEDGNYTQNDNNKNNNNGYTYSPNLRTLDSDIDGSKWGIEAYGAGAFPIANAENTLQIAGINARSSGFSYNVGLGARRQLGSTMFFRVGANIKLKRYLALYQGVQGSTNLSIEEQGNLTYGGIYMMIQNEMRIGFIIGGGFDLSFINVYSGNYKFTNIANGQVQNFQNETISLLSNTDPVYPDVPFNWQFDFNILLGYKIRMMQGAFNMKPFFQFSIPLVPVIDVRIPGVPINSPLYNTGINVSMLNLGIVFDVGFPPKPKVKSLLD